MLYCDCSAVSCGVDQLYGFEDAYTDDTPVEDMLKDASVALWDKARSETYGKKFNGKLACAMVVLSDKRGAAGDRFGDYLMSVFPADVVRLAAVNPNSGNDIVTYMWRPNTTALRLYPEWAAGRKRAADAWRDRARRAW